jgi:hypothetical protein
MYLAMGLLFVLASLLFPYPIFIRIGIFLGGVGNLILFIAELQAPTDMRTVGSVRFAGVICALLASIVLIVSALALLAGNG